MHVALIFRSPKTETKAHEPPETIIICFTVWLTVYVCLQYNHSTVRECFKRDEASQWKRPKFDPSPHQNPLTDLHKNWQA